MLSLDNSSDFVVKMLIWIRCMERLGFCKELETIFEDTMKQRSLLVILCLLVLFGCAEKSFALDKVAWFKTGTDSRFWPVVEQIMVSAAKDLQLELGVYNCNNDPFYMERLVKKVLANPDTRPDCVLIHNFKNRGQKILKLAEQFNVPVFLFNAGFPADSEVGGPREKYPHWIGQMLPDDEYGGYLLAKKLIAEASRHQNKSDASLQMVTLEGNRTSSASIKRIAGLKRALLEHPEVTNNQFFHSKWKLQRAKEAFLATRHRYPETTIFWTASETMSIGVIEAAKEQGVLPGKDIFTGGFDLLPENKKYIETGEMSVSVGAHYFEAGWALVLIRDYLSGLDFGNQGTTSFTTKMLSQTQDDIVKSNDVYNVLSTSLLDELDFKSLSKHFNPTVKKYDFNLTTFLQSIEK